MSTTYILVDGENIDATLGMSILGRRPESSERPRWDKVLEFCEEKNGKDTKALFFLNVSSGQLPMNFVQAIITLSWRPIPLTSCNENIKVVDIGIQRTLDHILTLPDGDIMLVSHDVDFIAQLEKFLHLGRSVTVLCFKEFLSNKLVALTEKGIKIYDLEHDTGAFTTPLPRVKVIDIDEFNPAFYI